MSLAALPSRPMTPASSTFARAGLRAWSLLLVATFGTNLLTAQQPPAAGAMAPPAATGLLGAVPTDDVVVPIHTAEPDGGVPYGIWAAGARYKASFHDGATFVPLLGMAYPHNLPWSWRTQSVRVGEHELVTQAPRLQWTAERAEYELGGVVEAYDVRLEGLEQTFVLRARPAAAGDLVLRGAVTTALHAAAVEAAHQALTFHDEAGVPIVTYGAAVAVDALGKRAAMTTTFAHGIVELRLAADWLQRATFPIVVDPLLGAAPGITGAAREQVDIVIEPTSIGESVWIAYSAAASASDLDLYFRRWTYGGTIGSTPFVDVTSSWSTSGGRCEFSTGVGMAIVVFDRLFPSQSRYLRFHRHDHNDLTTSTAFDTIAASDNAWRADVGAYGSSGGPHALVLWQQEPNNGPFAETSSSDIYGCSIDLSTGTANAPFVVANTTFVDHERPSVGSRRLVGSAGWLVAYQVYSTLVVNDDWDVVVRSVNENGVVSATLLVDNASADHKMAPVIDGQAGAHAVAFTTSTLVQQPGKPSGVNGHQIRVVRVDWDFVAGTASEPYGTVVLQSNADPRLEVGGLCMDRDTQSHWALLFRSNVTQQLYLRTVGYSGQQLQAETVVNPAGSDVSVPGGLSFSSNYRTFAIAYAVNGATNSVTFDRYDYPAVASYSNTGPGCSTATMWWDGSQLIGSYYNHVRVSGAPANAIHLLVVATAPAQGLLVGIPPFVDFCWLLVPNVGPDHLGILVDVGSSASWHLALPEFLGNGTFYFQDFHTDASGNFQFVSTQRLEVPVVK